MVSVIELRPGWIPEGCKNSFQLIQANEVIESKCRLSSLMWITMERGECLSFVGEMEGFSHVCREEGSLIWKPQPGTGRQAVSEWSVCPSLHPPQLDSLQHCPALLWLSLPLHMVHHHCFSSSLPHQFPPKLLTPIPAIRHQAHSVLNPLLLLLHQASCPVSPSSLPTWILV